MTNFLISKKKKIYILVALIFIFPKIFSQAPQYAGEPSLQSPNAATMGKFGDIPVSLFTGAPNISIPITEIKSGSISLPISLQYDAGGCRLDQHPTWVGLNWSLQTGGVIRRQTNGRFDEHVKRIGGAVMSYYNQYSTLAVSNWTSFTQYTANDLAPDEFSFTFNNISGKFMLNHEGKWVVQSKENLNLKVVHEIQNDYSLNLGSGNANLPRIFTKFILTTGDGTKYIFGGQSNAIEFSIPTVPSSLEGYNDASDIPISPSELSKGWETYIQPSAWHLTEIISPYGNRVTFSYTTDFSLQQSTYSEISDGILCGVQSPRSNRRAYDINLNNMTLIKSSYLDKIETENGIVCTFKKSVSNELGWVAKKKPLTDDYFVMKPSYLYRYYKLDNIEIKVNENITNKIAFTYIENSSERLKLKEVKFLSLPDNLPESVYKIEYTEKRLPNYNSGFEDHWGFYNGTNYWGNLSKQGNSDFQPPNIANYYQSRETNPQFMDAEIIKKITYPTGGYSEFTFEPHNYSKLVKQNPSITLESLSTNKIAGGLRIRKIETYDLNSTSAQVKEFFYNTNYITGGVLSSGVLAGEPVYYEAGVTNSSNASFYKFSSSPLNYLNTTNGNHITYSQVTEKSNDGYTIFTYSNQDNGYLDKEPFSQSNPTNTTIGKNQKKTFGKLDLERGQVLNTKYHASDKFLLKEVLNEYNDDPARYNSYVRSNLDVADPYVCGYNRVLFPIYTFYPYLKKQSTKEYFRNDTFINISTSYTYDPNSNLLRTISFINSEGNEIKTRYKYPIDYIFPPVSTIPAANEIHDIAALVTNNIVNVPVEVNNSIVKSGIEYITNGKLNYFEDLKPEKIFELETNELINVSNFNFSTISPVGFSYDSRYKEKISFLKYDAKGNVLEIKPADDIVTSYIWGYGSQYPIAKVVNASYQEISNVLGASTLTRLNDGVKYLPIPPNPQIQKIPLTDAEVRSMLSVLRTSLTNAQITIYTYKPLIGMTSETDINDIITYYEYDNLNRLKIVKDHEGNILSENEYNYKK